ncbi:MAG: hypothetical protein GF329_15365 [Candidatus Lokiarchaeota archaeon]|nr:hypothetical protein [Candidatus Lokiarchaeota archaeon]
MTIYFTRSSVIFKEHAKQEIGINNEFIDLFEGNFLTYSDMPPNKMIKKADGSIFITNIFPIYIMESEMHIEKIIEIGNDIDHGNLLDKEKTFKILTLTYDADIQSRDLEVKLGEKLEDIGYLVDFQNPEQLIFLVLYKNELYLGILERDEVLYEYLSPEKRFSREVNKLNRGENKLIEAIERFHLERNLKENTGIALDIGASPGGWTKILLEYDYKVYAVDPGKIDDSLKDAKNIVYIRKSIDEIDLEDKQFDLILNDANLKPSESTGIVNSLQDHLKEGSFVIMTIKLISRNVDRHLNEVKENLSQNFEIIKIKHLDSNRQEITMLLRKIK